VAAVIVSRSRAASKPRAAMFRRPLSLQGRSLLAASVALAAFLGITGFALDQAVFTTLRAALQERLQSHIYAYLAGSEVARGGAFAAPEIAPDPRFDQPGSGFYAGVVGEKSNLWRSPSALGKKLPFDRLLQRNEKIFGGPISLDGGESLYVLGMGVEWERPNRPGVLLTFYVTEDAQLLEAQMNVFRRTLLAYLGGLGVLLLLLLFAVLRWSLQPLRKVTADLARVERGAQECLSDGYPLELSGLARSLNDFIQSERDHLQRYRNTLADLAHSLKTPLAVIHSQLEADKSGEDFRWNVLEQVGRMDQIVAYQLSRAATSGHQTFAAPIAVDKPAEEIVRGLEKVYITKNILCEFDIRPDARFYGEQGDLLELLGNLLDNAFKWANRRVILSARALSDSGARRAGLELIVEDDGPGIPADQVQHMLQRGVRGDERVHGHGIGLAIVQNILKAYRGELQVDRSATLGGTAFRVRLGSA
jgi:two-component system, OmpR family, sensor histidine kinase PhoQ